MIQYCGSVIFTKAKVVVNRFLYLNYWGAFYIYWRFTKCTQMLIYLVCRDIGIVLYKILPTKWKRMKNVQALEEYYDKVEPTWSMYLSDYTAFFILLPELRVFLWIVIMFDIVLAFLDFLELFYNFEKWLIELLSLWPLIFVAWGFDFLVDKKIGGKENFIVFRRRCERKKKKAMYVFISSCLVAIIIAFLLAKL